MGVSRALFCSRFSDLYLQQCLLLLLNHFHWTPLPLEYGTSFSTKVAVTFGTPFDPHVLAYLFNIICNDFESLSNLKFCSFVTHCSVGDRYTKRRQK